MNFLKSCFDLVRAADNEDHDELIWCFKRALFFCKSTTVSLVKKGCGQ